jgi:hypothetical protein
VIAGGGIVAECVLDSPTSCAVSDFGAASPTKCSDKAQLVAIVANQPDWEAISSAMEVYAVPQHGSKTMPKLQLEKWPHQTRIKTTVDSKVLDNNNRDTDNNNRDTDNNNRDMDNNRDMEVLKLSKLEV